jgi:DNA-binding MarR family transcriptional regulator
LRKVERAFRKAGLLSYAWYALWELEQASERGLRPREIELQVLIAQSNISRLVDRMAVEGYVVRRPHEEDGRGQIVSSPKRAPRCENACGQSMPR